jgi:hypothetical protein
VLAAENWTQAALIDAGFAGWRSFAELRDYLKEIPADAGGMYVVYRSTTDEPIFLEKSPGGTWRGDPTVKLDALEAAWVEGANVVYIGKANPRQLRRRLRAYHSFGSGGAGRHFGGRYVWQLADAWDSLVAWRITNATEVPRDVEAAMIAAFVRQYGKRPFANLVG